MGMSATLLTGALLFWLDPFASRYEGKTVECWVDEFVASSGKIDPDVALGLGNSATPELLAILRRKEPTLQLLRIVPSERLQHFLIDDLKVAERHRVAGAWIALLHFMGEPVLGPVSEIKDSGSLGLIAYYADEATLDVYRVQTTNAVLKGIASDIYRVRSSSGFSRRTNDFDTALQRVVGESAAARPFRL